MSSVDIKYILISLLSTGYGLLSIAANPAAAEEMVTRQNSLNSENLTSLLGGETVSTRATDLLRPNAPVFKSTRQSDERLAQRELDLETFCQNYPLNSQCRGNTTNQEELEERSPNGTPTTPSGEQNQNATSQTKSGWAIVPEASTLGLGGQIVRKISPNFNARVGVNGFGLGIDIEETEVDYEGDLDLFNVSTIIDVHPFKNSGFRFSGGLVIGDNNFDGSADISEQVAEELDGEVAIDALNLDELATVDAEIDLNNTVAPYLGIGGGNAVGEGKGLGFWWNLGVVLGGSPEVDISSSVAADVPEEVRAEVEAAADEVLEDEEEELEDELDFINIYPVVSLGFSYQF